MRASSTPHASYGASRAIAGSSRISSIRSPSDEIASASDERRDAFSKTRTSSTTRPLAWSIAAPGLNAPVAVECRMWAGWTMGFLAERCSCAIMRSRRRHAGEDLGEREVGNGRDAVGGAVVDAHEVVVRDQPAGEDDVAVKSLALIRGFRSQDRLP